MADTNVATDETARLIASNKVEGTAVYNRGGDRLGTIHNFMVDKHSGKVEYAVMSFGGFLGIGEEYHPIPWDQLSYDTATGGYVVDLTKEVLEGGPRYRSGEEPAFDRAYGQQVSGYYGSSYSY